MLSGLPFESAVATKLEDFFFEWVATPKAQQLRQSIEDNMLHTLLTAEARSPVRDRADVAPPRSPAPVHREHHDDLMATCRSQELSRTKQLAAPSKGIPRFWRWKPSAPALLRARPLLQQVCSAPLTAARLEPLLEQLGLSRYLGKPLLARLQRFSGGNPDFEACCVYWERFKDDDPVGNFFHLVKDDANSYLEKRDLRDCVQAVVERHPGLEFLQDAAEFQERYCDTVICRSMYTFDRMDVGRISLRDLKRGKPCLVATWRMLDATDDINKVRDYFSYEHFYVLYCKFWELDIDHDFLLDREDLLRYDAHAYSRNAVDRIFSPEMTKRFSCHVPGKMGYEDFIMFLISDEDKTTDRSLEFFFRLVDIDSDGKITRHEIMYFYQEQAQRLECNNNECVSIADVVCQMSDMLSLTSGHFELRHFKQKRKVAGIFFSILLSLNKFLQYEQRDPFALRQEQIDHPDYTDWDRYCAVEYVRLAMEDGDQDESVSHDAGFLGPDAS